MKKMLPVLLISILLSQVLSAQTAKSYTEGYYTFTYPESFKGIEATAEAFNAIWNSFNEIFRFDTDTSRHICRVTILANKSEYDNYIQNLIGETRNQFLFLKYSKPELSELVLFPNADFSGYEAFAGPALNRQLFLQYLYTFVNEPPLWIRDGFQAFFETATYDPLTQSVVFETYSPWLDSAKLLHNSPDRFIDIEGILSAVTGTYESARFYPQAWAFVSFLLNSEKAAYQRFLYEAFFLLENRGQFNDESRQENTDVIKNRFFQFYSGNETNTDFSLWLAGEKTYNDLVQNGVTAYNEGDFAAAKQNLSEAMSIREQDPLIAYYLGLVSYAEKNYKDADAWYQKALAYGADISTVNWALGLSAYADGRYSEAAVYLRTAKTSNPARYADRVDALLNSIP
ncbi:hypothetical protein K7I13_01460 [Brucepastera parasyntrophica]|uniref:tetratricopeptide repeat protein n=1 Tax=Brucepastera parasyntrophica TaxID=2880008 RepID=UPI00210B362F|nr:hypothetical protein [Brucepastera parasyntrophica]ULQ60028.1 hypothetical protein K7I13_01460 [Brucepastera parasyntrophica]